MFALAIGVGQATTRLNLSQAHLLAGYTLLAVVATLFIDMYSGFVMAAFGLVIGAHIFGLIGHLPKVITGEIMLVAGMLLCGFSGPSGGLWTSNNTVPDDRRGTDGVGVAATLDDVQVPDRATD
ncbi:hypothetical protein JQV19_08360 [Sulfitobacter mediterraneus]|uniref:hypothetical protein n=1 Tax=Sulfitobacter mediterraneus TaxID=83219 RepID=UPI00193A5025|nr:hypothetical protein [Sulfitobacter mediterraneus]MBM1556658.1 hypothetical protein [Sulfitobacter mediterraneus]MBM1570146.1 hypothetical protein [Sulfitobacter mediterraneus]MBM1574102.1 hypothetical protein [Sulfitobacter mediterraneus]MBM1577888.1 hypothetical protein [Sulfitobacter mediterraneus]MBM1579616.1 hypothetical protein [Sulfitobacter mediterraneus]